MFQFPALASVHYFTHAQMTGFYPSRISPFGNIRVNARVTAHRTLSWFSTSFIADMSQGIHLVLYLAFSLRFFSYIKNSD